MHRLIHPGDLVTYTFEQLDGLPVCGHVSTRHGGVSPAPWSSLNFSVTRGDAPERVAENFARFCATFGIDPAHPVRTHQVHGTGVAKVTWDDAGVRHKVDGLITDEVGLPLFLVFADCVPLLLYDRQNHALGVCHAGWRGTLNGAGLATLWAMQAAYGTDPSHVYAGIGPSIGPQSYEVGPEVYDLAQVKLPYVDDLFTFPNGPERNPYFDLWQANARQFEQAGIPPAQIEIGGVDTARNIDDFYSHRAEQGRCGLFGMMAWLD